MWNNLIRFSSFETLLELRVVPVLATTASFLIFSMDFPLVTMVAIFDSSPESEPKSCCTSMFVLCFLDFFGLNQDEASNNALHHDPP